MEFMHDRGGRRLPDESWYRIFPHALDSPQMERLVSTLPPGDELTDLDETTAAFLRYRMQQFEHVK
tara:strand:+ start:990 stop:1187 length:198 start_codon:yes stop_codon:yes gene_type:complete